MLPRRSVLIGQVIRSYKSRQMQLEAARQTHQCRAQAKTPRLAEAEPRELPFATWLKH